MTIITPWEKRKDDDNWHRGTSDYMQDEITELRAFKERVEKQRPVASIYIRGDDREFDDWKCDLPAGRNELYALPPVNVELVESQTMEWHLDSEAAGFLAGLINAGDEPTSVNLKLGHIKDDDGKVSYGLLVLDAEYPEEGASLLVECAPPSPAISNAQAKPVEASPVNAEWDEKCVLGHCGSPSGCERDMACRANASKCLIQSRL